MVRAMAALRRIAGTLSLAALAGCAAPTRPVTIAVEDAGAPVAGALVTAAPLEMSDVPLPLDSENLANLLAAENERRGGVTDADGRLRLTLLDGRPHLVMIASPPLGGGAWRWEGVLDVGADPGGLTPSRADEGASGVAVRVAR